MDNKVHENLDKCTDYYAVNYNFRARGFTDGFSPYLKAKISQALEEFAALLPDRLTQFQKVCLLYQCIASEGIYSPNPHPMSYRFLGALRDRDAVCKGYAELMTILLNTVVGCRAYTVIGYTTPSIEKTTLSDSSHAWNLVVFSDGSAYHMDVTWDLKNVSAGRPPQWFLRSDSEMKRYWIRDKYPAAARKFTGRIYRDEQLLARLRAQYRSLKSRFAEGTYSLPRFVPEDSAQASCVFSRSCS